MKKVERYFYPALFIYETRKEIAIDFPDHPPPKPRLANAFHYSSMAPDTAHIPILPACVDSPF